jgi:peptidoglycan/LPS O-acetylase OafA/YrhL
MGSTTEQTGVRKNYLCLQALRAVAAGLVVVHHSITTGLDWIMHQTGGLRWTNGAAGVHIFFVISGFVMAISLPGLAGKPNKGRVFLWRRFGRIVPLYWTAITVRLVQLKLRPSASLNCALTPWRIAASYLFIPARNGRGDMFPVVEPGWTLNYEVFFYLLFAAALALNVSPLAFLTPCLTALALVGMVRPAAGWPDFTSVASPLVLEFLYGVVLAHLATRRKLPGNALGALLLGGGFLALMLVPEGHAPWGFVLWGLPAAAIVTGAVALEDELGGRLPKWLLEAGDASYALYLSHTFILPYMGNAISRLHVTGVPALAAVVVLGMGVCFPAAVLVHRYVEKPLMGLFKKPREGSPPTHLEHEAQLGIPFKEPIVSSPSESTAT